MLCRQPREFVPRCLVPCVLSQVIYPSSSVRFVDTTTVIIIHILYVGIIPVTFKSIP